MIQKKYYKLVRVSYEDSAMFRMTNISDQTGNFSVTKTGSPTARNMEYSTDGVTWTAYDFTNLPTVEVPAGGNIYLRGNNSSGFNRDSSNIYNLTIDVNHNIGGNICSLIDKTNPENVTTLSDFCFYGLFQNNTHLVSAGNMNFGNVNIIKNYNFRQIFKNCTSLTTPPDMSSVTSVVSNGCESMFYGCTSLTIAPDLSSVTSISDTGCRGMFSGCTALTTSPDLSSVISIGNYGCYEMFNSCTSLTTPPDLTSLTTVGDNGCQNMFYDCTSLTTAPDLSSVTSVGIVGYARTFYNCYKLSSVTTPNISEWDTSKFGYWLYWAGTQATGTKTVYKPAALTIPTGSNDGVPTGWTVANY